MQFEIWAKFESGKKNNRNLYILLFSYDNNMQNQIFGKRPKTHIDAIISAFEDVIGRYSATNIQQMQNATRIENVYEVPSKGGIIARFVPHNGPRFTITNPDQTSTLADAHIIYLGFDETSREYNSMVSDVQSALEGK